MCQVQTQTMPCAQSISFRANLSLTVSYVTNIAFNISGRLYRAAHIIHIRTAVLNLGPMGRFHGVRKLR
jgi:hypothetical protein